MIKKLIVSLIVALIASTAYAVQYTDNYNLAIPAIADRNWISHISKDVVSLDTLIYSVENGTMTLAQVKTNAIVAADGIGPISTDVALTVGGTAERITGTTNEDYIDFDDAGDDIITFGTDDQESINLDLGTGNNTVTVSSDSGVSIWDFNTMRVTADTVNLIKVNANASSKVSFFDTTDVANTADGKAIGIFRKAAEGDNEVVFYINQYRTAFMQSDATTEINATTNPLQFKSTTFRVRDPGDVTNKLWINETGRVGMGTVTPGVSLDVLGGIKLQEDGGGDYVTISHDGTDCYIRPSDGNTFFQTDEGTNNDSALLIKGKGTGGATLWHLHGTNANATMNEALAATYVWKTFGTNIGEYVINAGQQDCNYFVRTQPSTSTFFVDGGTSRVGIGTNAPTVSVDVAGAISCDELMVSPDSLSPDAIKGTIYYNDNTEKLNYFDGTYWKEVTIQS